VAACPHCRSENRRDARFCGECGASLALLCPACGSQNEAARKFCYDCGAPLGPERDGSAAAAPTVETVAERRLVSVLFADLVGFTTLSESRDPEEVRELLSRYFDSCRRLVELYGGVVEKFIGDAVMAVWGTPIAQEDDAERAVRAALDLVAAVSAFGDEVGSPELRARAGVLTGEAAVNLGATSEGMVAGDLVNTAARIQAAADPGAVLVGEATRRASERAIVYEDAGTHALKGKAEPVPLYRAVRVTAARGGALRSEGLEAPFVGRERELRLVKELFHAGAEQSRAQLVQISGIAGIGKSRLAWEFFKYLDGLAEAILWHRGRCLAYGEGVTYWALAEMVRTRAQILEGEDTEAGREKLAACLARYVPDADERAWVGPRLANLLGLEERVDSDRQDLFAAWRLFLERLADTGPVVLVFEDLQWADQALLAFIEYLLEWSSSKRLYVLALARPELMELHPDFARGARNATTLSLEPLSDDEMGALLLGYVPGLSPELTAQILERAQGVPLYAVETVRMLLDRGLLVRDGPVYRPTGEIRTLEIPETLHALAAARLDGLPAEERQLVQDACVLGTSFGKNALAVLTGRSEDELEPLLAALVRKELLSLQADPRQPARGQYGFLQELVRRVAYDTLSRRDRKSRHLAAAEALEQSLQDAPQDIPEVIASHLLAAADAVPDDPDVPQIRLQARAALVQAGERAAGLAAPDEAQRYLEQAAALAVDAPSLQADLLVRAGTLALQAGNIVEARQRLDAAIVLQEQHGDATSVARAKRALGDVDVRELRLEEAIRRFESALPALEEAGAEEELAATLGQLARMQTLRGDVDEAAATVERALRLAEALALDEVLVHALTTKASVLGQRGHFVECRLLLEGALARARAGGLYAAWWRTANNLAVQLERDELYTAMLELIDEIEVQARRRGDRDRLASARIGVISTLVELGRWQEALDHAAEADELRASRHARGEAVSTASILCEQGRLDAAQALLDDQAWQRGAEQWEHRVNFAAAEARLLRARNRPAEALAVAAAGFAQRSEFGFSFRGARQCFVEALEAALELHEGAKAAELLAEVDALRPGEVTPSLEAQRARFHARLGHGDPDRGYRSAETIFSAHGLVFHRAVAQTEHAEWLTEHGRTDEAAPLLDRARATFQELDARPWLDRIDRAQPVAPGHAPHAQAWPRPQLEPVRPDQLR
jgi:class 3 adenylate cyclase/tetratricopeptide (TPR) repeat protein